MYVHVHICAESRYVKEETYAHVHIHSLQLLPLVSC